MPLVQGLLEDQVAVAPHPAQSEMILKFLLLELLGENGKRDHADDPPQVLDREVLVKTEIDDLGIQGFQLGKVGDDATWIIAPVVACTLKTV